MSLNRPTLPKLIQRVLTTVEGYMDGGPYSRGDVEYALSLAVAGLGHGVWGYLEWCYLQLIPDTDDARAAPRWAALFGIAPNPPSSNVGTATFPAVSASGATIPAGTVITLANGTRYLVDADASESSGSITVSITAETAGLDGRADEGDPIYLAQPLPQVTSEGVVGTGGLTGGADAETAAAQHQRFLTRLRNPPRGGGRGDYVRWATEVSGVDKAAEFPRRDGLGTVVVGFTVPVATAYDDPTPNATKIQEVQTYLDDQAPETIRYVRVFGATAVTMNVTISSLVVESGYTVAEVQANITAALEAFMLSEADIELPIARSRLDEAISGAAGEASHTLDSPASGVDFDPGTEGIAVLGTVTFV